MQRWLFAPIDKGALPVKMKLSGLLVAVCLLAAACGGSSTTSTSTDTVAGDQATSDDAQLNATAMAEADRTQVLDVQDTTMTVLDPVTEVNGTTLSTMSLIYDNLIRTTHRNQAVPGLAESWSSPDPQTFTMQLRKGVVFQDGTPFDGNAVAANIERGKTAERSALKGVLKPVETVDVSSDGLTVTLHLSTPSAGLMPGVFAGMAGLIPSPTAVAANPDKYGLDTAVGAGAFEVDEFAPVQTLNLVTWDGYWQPEQRLFAGVNVRTEKSDQVVPGLVSQGQLDIGFAKDGQFEQLDGTPGIEYKATPTSQFTEMFVNYGVAPWNDPKVRQALQYAMDRPLLAEAMTSGKSEPASQPVPPSSWAFNPDLEGKYPHDPAKAKQLLADAGFPDGLKGIKVGNIDYDYYRPLAEAVQDMLKKSDIFIDLVPIPAAGIQQALYQDKSVSAAITAYSPPSPTDPGQTLEAKFSTNGVNNPSHTTTPGVDEALARGAATTDQAVRATAYQEALGIVMDQALSIPLYYNAGITIFGPKVRNVVVGEQPSRAANWTSEPLVYLVKP